VKQKQKIVLPLICISLFVTMAALGWSKLEYGFNMIDEGMYMVDGWRLAVGDNLFPDSAINAIQLFNVFNALIFAFNPDITLLGFREMAYTLVFDAPWHGDISLGTKTMAASTHPFPVRFYRLGYTG
jgi:hypothetical protein